MTRGPSQEVTLQDVWDTMDFGKPETASTLGEKFSCHPDTVFNRLEELEKNRYIKTKKISAKSRVWWKPTHNPGIVPDDIDIDSRSKKDPKIIRVLAEAKRVGEPMTSGDIEKEIDETQDMIYNRLRKLEERAWVNSLNAGATGRVWWLADVEIEGGGEKNLNLSPALKEELKQVRDRYDGPQNLAEAVIFVMKYPDTTDSRLEGDEDYLEPIKVPESTHEYIRDLRDDGEYPDFEAVIRDNADIESRPANQISVKRVPLSERTTSTTVDPSE